MLNFFSLLPLYIFLCLFSFLSFNTIHSQTFSPFKEKDPLLLPSGPHFRLGLNKDNISWIWNGDLVFTTRAWNRSQLGFSNRFSSVLLRETAFQNNWQDENRFRLLWSIPLATKLETGTILQSTIFSDDNTKLQFNKNLLAQELSIKVHPLVKIEPAAGWAIEESYGIQDNGPYAKIGLKINNLDMGGYLNSTDYKSILLGFPDRNNQEHSVFTSWKKQFSASAFDSLRIGYQYFENRFYIRLDPNRIDETASLSDRSLPPDVGIEQVIIKDQFVNNQLLYILSRNSNISILTELRNRDVDQSNLMFNNRREELFFGNQFNYQITTGNFSAVTGMLFSQNVRNNLDVITDIDALEAGFIQRLRLRPSIKDLSWLHFSYSKFEYNTPSELNIDDRDELRFIINGGYRHEFTNQFSAAIKGFAHLYHQIFINSGRSQSNNWNRIYQLSTNFEHRITRWLELRQQLRILANYTVFDFDEILPQTRSFVFRRLAYTDSLFLKLDENLTLRGIYQYETEDNGTFFKENFSQQVTREQRAHFLYTALQLRNFAGFKITTGISFYWRDEWALRPLRTTDKTITERTKVREFRSVWPRLSITYTASPRLILLATYAPNRSTNFGTEEQFFTTGKLNIQYFF
jgi:hypothetical protein